MHVRSGPRVSQAGDLLTAPQMMCKGRSYDSQELFIVFASWTGFVTVRPEAGAQLSEIVYAQAGPREHVENCRWLTTHWCTVLYLMLKLWNNLRQ